MDKAAIETSVCWIWISWHGMMTASGLRLYADSLS